MRRKQREVHYQREGEDSLAGTRVLFGVDKRGNVLRMKVGTTAVKG